MKKTVKAPSGYHWMKKGNSYKLMKGAYKPHKGAVKMAKFTVQKRHDAKLCPAGKAAAKIKFKVYIQAHMQNMWASKYCKGKVGRKKKSRKLRKRR